jgi:hypothetical protein
LRDKEYDDEEMKEVLREIKDSLDGLKLGYIDTVLKKLETMSETINSELTVNTEKIQNFFEASTNSVIELSENYEIINQSISSLSSNQSDQLETLASVRDTLTGIVQVELKALKDQVTMFLEQSVNEIKMLNVETKNEITNLLGKMHQLEVHFVQFNKNQQELKKSIEEVLTKKLHTSEQAIQRKIAMILNELRRIEDKITKEK